MRASVVIPCWNEEPMNLTQAVESVRGSGAEIIVVDDGSTRTETVACLDALDVRVVRTPNRGPAAAINLGCSVAQGEYILRLDSDDWVEEGFIDALAQAMDGDARITIAYTAWRDFGVREEYHQPPLEISPSQMAVSCPIVASALFRREDWLALGGFDETLRQGFEDWEWWVRLLLQRGGVARFVQGPVFHYRIKEKSRNIANSQGIGPLADTRRAMLANNPEHVAAVSEGLVNDLRSAYELGQNQSPIAIAATEQARYWANRYGKIEGAISMIAHVVSRMKGSISGPAAR